QAAGTSPGPEGKTAPPRGPGAARSLPASAAGRFRGAPAGHGQKSSQSSSPPSPAPESCTGVEPSAVTTDTNDSPAGSDSARELTAPCPTPPVAVVTVSPSDSTTPAPPASGGVGLPGFGGSGLGGSGFGGSGFGGSGLGGSGFGGSGLGGSGLGPGGGPTGPGGFSGTDGLGARTVSVTVIRPLSPS